MNKLPDKADYFSSGMSLETQMTVDSLAEQAAQDRQQAAIDRQEFRTEIRQIWEYLRERNGGSSTPQR
jgi:hypothetical protein